MKSQLNILLKLRVGRRILHLAGLGGMCVMAILIVVAANLTSDGAKIFLIIVTLGFVVFFAGNTLLNLVPRIFVELPMWKIFKYFFFV